MSHGIRVRVGGRFACFTRPENKGERVSYDVMTPSAARGILDAIHWKPAIRWVIDEIAVLKPIRFHTLRRNEIGGKIPVDKARGAMRRGSLEGLGQIIEQDRQQRAATLLTDVEYVISAHFDLTGRAGAEDTPGKHLDIFTRRARRGQCFHQPCLGTREFPATFALVEPDAPPPRPAAIDRDLGLMLWDLDHAGDRAALFFPARLTGGVLRVPPPDSPEIRR